MSGGGRADQGILLRRCRWGVAVKETTASRGPERARVEVIIVEAATGPSKTGYVANLVPTTECPERSSPPPPSP